MNYNLLTFSVSISSLVAAFALWLSRQNTGEEKMRKVSSVIAQEAKAFLVKEYKTLILFIIIVFISLGSLMTY